MSRVPFVVLSLAAFPIALVAVACSEPNHPAPTVVSAAGPSATPAASGATIAPATPDASTVAVAAGAASSSPNAFQLALLNVRSKSKCDDFDYFPAGGMQNLWCHAPLDFTYATLHDASGLSVFASGPHGAMLDLSNSKDFGHYNPAFVGWVQAHVVPQRDDAYRQQSQDAYDRAVKPLATIFWRVHQKMVAEPACFTREKDAYEKAIKSGKLPAGYYERWFFFMNPAFCTREAKGGKLNDTWYFDHGMDGGVDGNVTKSVVGFWARRTMDGTADAFGQLLGAVVAAYDPDLPNGTSAPPPPPLLPPAPPPAAKHGPFRAPPAPPLSPTPKITL
jgi:hypothetical protein